VSLQTAFGIGAEMLDLNADQENFQTVPLRTLQGIRGEWMGGSFWTETLGVSDHLECTKCVVTIAGVLDGVCIGVHAVNCLHTVINITVEHAGVHLSLVLCTSGCKTKESTVRPR